MKNILSLFREIGLHEGSVLQIHSPLCLRTTAICETADELEQTGLQPADDAMFGQKLAVYAVDGKVRQVAT